MFQPHHTTMLRVVRVVTIALLIWLFALPLFVSALTVSIVQMPLLLLTVLSVLIPLFPRFKEWRTQPEVLLPTWTIIGTNFFFCISRTLSIYVSSDVYFIWFLLEVFLSSALCWYMYDRMLSWINRRAENRAALEEVLPFIETARPLLNNYQKLKQSGKTPSPRLTRRITDLCEQLLAIESGKHHEMSAEEIRAHTARRNYKLSIMINGQPALDKEARTTIYNALHIARNILLSSLDDT